MHLGREVAAQILGLRRNAGGGLAHRRAGRRRRRLRRSDSECARHRRANAPTGAEQPASRAARTARSAVTAARVRGSSSTPRKSIEVGAVGPALHGQRALAGRGQHLLDLEDLGDLGLRPIRPGPAAASTTACSSPEVTLPIRVSALPRIGTYSRSGRSARSWATRRGEPVPTRAPGGRSANLAVADQRVAGSSRGRARRPALIRAGPAWWAGPSASARRSRSRPRSACRAAR